MEEGEMEMTHEELKMWIRATIKKEMMISTDVLEKYKLLQSLLEKRQKQAAKLLELNKSVAACEVIVKKKYSLLGLEYGDSDSDDDDSDDDDDSVTRFGNTPRFPHELVHMETEVGSTHPTNSRTPLLTKQDQGKLYIYSGKKVSVNLKRQPVVVLTRLPPCKIRRSCPPSLLKCNTENETLKNTDSDEQWEPDDDSSCSDLSDSSYNSGPNKKRKIDQKDETPDRSHATPRASKNTAARQSNATKKSTPQANTDATTKSNATRQSTGPADNGAKPVGQIPAPGQSSSKATGTQDNPTEISVNMNVLARRKTHNIKWQHSTIVEIVEKNGRIKYKVKFEENKRRLVSGHHIAFEHMPRASQLPVGTRVVVHCKGEKPQFLPGILAEIPSRRNRMRFLVILDNHRPLYVGLPLLHLVCKPLPDPLDDIADETHRKFMKEYIEDWPYPPQTQCRIGQTLNAKVDGVHQRCEVQAIDCSLIQVVFQKDLRTEWIYRGSMRLEHMINMRECLEMKKEELQRNKSVTASESPKSSE